MLQFVIGGILGVAAVGGAIYSYFSNDDKSKNTGQDNKILIGSIALWGVPNSGKTTFVSRLLGEPCTDAKTQTNSIKEFKDLTFVSDGKEYVIEKIYDMPGVSSRKEAWLDNVQDSKTSVYLINLERYFAHEDTSYQKIVKQHLKELKVALVDNKSKNLILVGTHLDKTSFSDSADANNLIQSTSDFEIVLAALQDLSIWFYSVNLLSDESCNYLIKNIVGDISAKK